MRRTTRRDKDVQAAFDRFYTSTEPKPDADRRLRRDLRAVDSTGGKR